MERGIITEGVIRTYLEQVKIGRKQSYMNLTLIPLLSAYLLDLDYLLLDEALQNGLLEVAEVTKEGSVPDLKVVNHSPKMVFILDGEELVGAKQNRIVNTTGGRDLRLDGQHRQRRGPHDRNKDVLQPVGGHL